MITIKAVTPKLLLQNIHQSYTRHDIVIIADFNFSQCSFMPLFSLYAPWKHQKNKGFLLFSGGKESHWHDLG